MRAGTKGYKVGVVVRLLYSDDYSRRSGSYKYDVDSQVLTVVGGECHRDEADIPRKGMKAQTPILVLEDTEELGDYVGTNAYGAKVKVRKSREDKYILNVSVSKARRSYPPRTSIFRDCAR